MNECNVDIVEYSPPASSDDGNAWSSYLHVHCVFIIKGTDRSESTWHVCELILMLASDCESVLSTIAIIFQATVHSIRLFCHPRSCYMTSFVMGKEEQRNIIRCSAVQSHSTSPRLLGLVIDGQPARNCHHGPRPGIEHPTSVWQ